MTPNRDTFCETSSFNQTLEFNTENVTDICLIVNIICDDTII